MSDPGAGATRSSAIVKSPQELVAGLAIIAVAGTAFWLGRDLPLGTLGGMGPGMLPRSVAVLLGLLGLAIAITGFLHPGPGLGTWSIRGVLAIGAAILVFAYAIRPLGLLVAAPVALVIAALATDETRWGETIVFGAAMSAFCIGLFKFALGLPIPLAPWWLGY